MNRAQLGSAVQHKCGHHWPIRLVTSWNAEQNIGWIHHHFSYIFLTSTAHMIIFPSIKGDFVLLQFLFPEAWEQTWNGLATCINGYSQLSIDTSLRHPMRKGDPFQADSIRLLICCMVVEKMQWNPYKVVALEHEVRELTFTWNNVQSS